MWFSEDAQKVVVLHTGRHVKLQCVIFVGCTCCSEFGFYWFAEKRPGEPWYLVFNKLLFACRDPDKNLFISFLMLINNDSFQMKPFGLSSLEMN